MTKRPEVKRRKVNENGLVGESGSAERNQEETLQPIAGPHILAMKEIKRRDHVHMK